MDLVNYIIKDLLPEKQDFGKTVAAYGGGFKPATKGHFEVVKQALKQNPDIDEFIIFVGGKERDGITKEEATLIWDLYEKYLPMGKIKIVSDNKPPIKAIYNYASDNPTEKVLFILGAREGNEDDFKDITNRTKVLDNYPNMSLRTIVTQQGASGTAARNALKISYEKFQKFLPSELSEDEKKMIYNMLSKKYVAESLEDWFEKEDWVRINTSGNITGPCGTMKKGKPTTRCLPRKKAQSLTKAERKATVAKKVRGSKKGKQFVKNTKKGKVKLKEGKYDSLVTQLSGFTLNAWKGDFEDNQKIGKFEIEIGPGKELDYPHLDFKYNGIAKFGKDSPYNTNGVARPFKPEVEITFTIPSDELPRMWSQIAMDLRNVIRHEIEHLMQAGPNVKKGKEMDSDQAERAELRTGKKPWWKIWRSTLGTADYYKLEKEIDANLQGLYLKAKKSRQPLEDVVDNYLRYELNLSPEDREDIKTLWKQRASKLSIPLEEGRKKKKDPKKGTGRKPEGSGRRLYTDEDPKDTIGIKFSTRQDIVNTLNKKSFKAKSHARKSQIINLIHQRVRAALGRTKDPKKKKRLQTAFKYILKRKEASKAKTQRLNKQKNENVAPNHKGKAAPYGSGYKKFKQKTTTNLNEALDPKTFDFTPHIKSLTTFMEDNGLKLQPYPKIKFIHSDVDNGTNLLGKTAYYTPDNNEVVLYTYGRHPKDILRSYAHELVHVHQNMEDRLEHTHTTNVNQDDYLKELEKEAYETGNILFRSWSDTLVKENTTKIPKKKVKDPFGIMAYAAELGRLREDETPNFKVYLDMDGVLADFDKRFNDLSGMLPQPFVDKFGLKSFWDLIDEKHKVAFWRGIEIMPGAKALVDAAKEYDYELLTAPSAKKQSRIGKNLWVQDKVGSLFGSKPKVNFRKAKEKHMIKPTLTKSDVLIDDRADTIERWERAGGTGIQYFTANQAIKDLRDLKV